MAEGNKRKDYVRGRWSEWTEFVEDAVTRMKGYLNDTTLSQEALNRKCSIELRNIGYFSRAMNQFAYRVRREGTAEGETMKMLESESNVD